MRIEQGELLEVNYLLPDDKLKPHPAVVISCNDVNIYENAYICVMISSVETDDEYSFWLDDYMLTKPSKKRCQVRCQLITIVPEKQIIQKLSKIKKQFLKKIIDKIFDTTFKID